MRRIVICMLVSLFVAGCGTDSTQPLPTVSSVELAQTAQFLTQNAPPSGFQLVQFPKIDENLTKQSNWHYSVSLKLDGEFTDSSETAKGLIAAEVYSNEVAGERRVVLKLSGNVFGQTNEVDLEEVRIRNDYYLVDDKKNCSKVNNASPGQLADFNASDLINGIRRGTPNGQHKVVNNLAVWDYSFSPDDLVLPNFDFNLDNTNPQLSKIGQYTIDAGDLWVAPSANLVWYYTATINVHRVALQQDRYLTGTVLVNYQLDEIGVPYNIAIPFGC